MRRGCSKPSVTRPVWSITGFCAGSNPLYHVLRWRHAACSQSRSAVAPVRGQHAGLWRVSTICHHSVVVTDRRLRRQLDEIKQTSAKCGQDWTLWCATSRRQRQLPTSPLLIDGAPWSSQFVTWASTLMPTSLWGLMIYGRRRSEHITDALHWLQAPERIHFKISVLAYKVLHGHASQPLGPLVRVADVPGRRALLSADTDLLEVPPVRRSTISSRALPVTAACMWNVLPREVTSSPTVSTFRQNLKSFLFHKSFV